MLTKYLIIISLRFTLIYIETYQTIYVLKRIGP